MATIYGTQYEAAYVDVPASKIQQGDLGGHRRCLYFDHTITAAPTAADVLKLGKLPKGARIIEACLAFPDLGTTGVLNLGWAASEDGLEAADADALLAAVDVNAAAAIKKMSGIAGAASAGFLKKLLGDVDLQVDIATAWTATSGTIKGYVEYIVD